MESGGLKTSTGAYLGCLFLTMANEQYEPVKRFLQEAFLAEKQQYSRNALAIKRVMVDFISTDTGKPKRLQ